MTKKCHVRECRANPRPSKTLPPSRKALWRIRWRAGDAKDADLAVGATVKSGRGLPQSKTLARVWVNNQHRTSNFQVGKFSAGEGYPDRFRRLTGNFFRPTQSIIMKKLRSDALWNELGCERHEALDKWLADRRYNLAPPYAAAGRIRNSAVTHRRYNLFGQKNYKVRPLRVDSFACGYNAMIKGGFCRSDFARPSIDLARPCAAGGRVRSSAVAHRRCNFALQSSKSQNSNRLLSPIVAFCRFAGGEDIFYGRGKCQSQSYESWVLVKNFHPIRAQSLDTRAIFGKYQRHSVKDGSITQGQACLKGATI